jgi:hypothetical protein
MDVLGIVIIVVVLVLLTSAGAGTWASYDAPKPTGDELAADKCAVCKAEQEWYESLSGWEQAAYFAWWVARGAVCAAKGC